ncbi:hypothetical protein SDC9_125275 [bioreactor metagenome]|uniref:Uncharacterized protein n=1 Tax=bioreactor metagenome TaxID=1076179 RepID=A0A645CN10_9ZZZZ
MVTITLLNLSRDCLSFKGLPSCSRIKRFCGSLEMPVILDPVTTLTPAWDASLMSVPVIEEESWERGNTQLSSWITSGTPLDSNHSMVCAGPKIRNSFLSSLPPRGYAWLNTSGSVHPFVRLQRPPPEIETFFKTWLLFSNIVTCAWGKFIFTCTATKKPAAPPPIMATRRSSIRLLFFCVSGFDYPHL